MIPVRDSWLDGEWTRKSTGAIDPDATSHGVPMAMDP